MKVIVTRTKSETVSGLGGKLSFPAENKHVCIYALSSLLPLLPAKQRKMDEPDDWLPKVFEVECPDPKGRVIWEITCEE